MKRLLLIVNFRTLLVTGLALGATAACIHSQVIADYPMTLLATAVVFPVVFSIYGAYERREQVLAHYATLKANGRSMYLASRDWLEHADAQAMDELRGILGNLLGACDDLLQAVPPVTEGKEDAVYKGFSRLSSFIKTEQRGRGLAATEVARANLYLNQMLQSFEALKHVHQYRTPKTLKLFGDLFILLLPAVYAPYFAYLATQFAPLVVFAMPITFAVILTALANIRDQLENPFDQYGEDDVQFHVEKFVASLERMGPEVSSG